MKHAQLVIGPAGSGKSTYCSIIQDHCNNVGRTIHVVNMDPAADEFRYSVSFDIRDLVTLEDVQEEMGLGPNGGLVYCMEYLSQNLDWLRDEVHDYTDDYLLIDLPGQIELYSHHPHVIRSLIRELQNCGYFVGIVYCMDSQFVDEPSKFISGVVMCLSAMVNFEVPLINVLTKVDLLKDDESKMSALEEYLDADVSEIADTLNADMFSNTYRRLNAAIAGLIADFGMVSFVPLDISDEESIEYVLSMIDNALQYGEDLEIKEYPDHQDGDNDHLAQWAEQMNI